MATKEKESRFSFFEKLKAYFTLTNQTGQLIEDILQQKERLIELQADFEEEAKWRAEFNDSLAMLTSYLGAMFWKKDKDLRYILASPIHCRDFFGISFELECLNYITGKTAGELIKTIYLDRGLNNTFEKVCDGSDFYTKDTMKICHFFEAGVIDDEQMLLYVIKKPIIKDGKFAGLYGLAWDLSEYSGTMTKLLNRWIYADRAKAVYLDKDVFIYELTPEVQRCDIFTHICPYPDKKAYFEERVCQLT